MFTVSVPEHNYIEPVEVSTLKKAIHTKYEIEHHPYGGFHAVITDLNGYIVSMHEQETYLAG